MSDYNMSLMGGIIGFLWVLGFKLYKHSQKAGKYLDVLVTAFLFAAISGFIGAFLGGQIYGVPTSLPIWVIYSETSKIPYTSAIIPLALIYAIGSFLIFCCVYISKEFLKISGAIGYLGIALFALMILIGEFFSGSDDIVRDLIFLNFSQIGALVGLGYAWIWLFREIRSVK
jgi:prolipoprotein diacylglyceryltransferase